MSIPYCSYCCTLGTTSFRPQELNRKIERQLVCLEEFWGMSQHATAQWAANPALQQEYYELLKGKGFVVGDAPRPAKDAREKTSGLVEIGLIDDERRITLAGQRILAIAKAGDFTCDGNLLDVSRDSYLYFLQLLKASKTVNDHAIRPFVVFMRLLNGLEGEDKHLTRSEFGYLLQLCIDEASFTLVLNELNAARRQDRAVDVDAVIVSVLMAMENYRQAHDMLMRAECVGCETIVTIGMNRKSGPNGDKQFDACYLPVFRALHDIAFNEATERRAQTLLKAVEQISGNCRTFWQSMFFPLPHGKRLPKLVLPILNKEVAIFKVDNEGAFRDAFFKTLHLFKAKSTLKDYADLNRRYFALSDCVIFQDGKVYLDALPAALAANMSEWLKRNSFSADPSLPLSIQLDALLGINMPSIETLVVNATGRSAEEVRAAGGARALMNKERYSKLAMLLDRRFTKEKIIKLLSLLEDRKNDMLVKQQVTDDADVPTIFEYLVALAWYYVSGRRGDVLSYMNLSLGPDLLPKVHAGGGEADIVWRYDRNRPHYESHTLMIEVTLAERDTQRRMEMEPVSRHLGDYLIAHSTDNAYCTFVTTNLNPNVISDYKSRRMTEYYNSDGSMSIRGMKIIPIDTRMLRRMLEKDTTYPTIYEEFEEYHNTSGSPVPLHRELRRVIES